MAFSAQRGAVVVIPHSFSSLVSWVVRLDLRGRGLEPGSVGVGDILGLLPDILRMLVSLR